MSFLKILTNLHTQKEDEEPCAKKLYPQLITTRLQNNIVHYRKQQPKT